MATADNGAATACGLLATATPTQQQASADAVVQLQQLEVQCAFVSSDSAASQPPMTPAAITTAIDADAVVAQAHCVLTELGIHVPTAPAPSAQAVESTAT